MYLFYRSFYWNNKNKREFKILKNNIKNIEKLKFKYFYYNHKNLMNIIEFKKIDKFLEFN